MEVTVYQGLPMDEIKGILEMFTNPDPGDAKLSDIVTDTKLSAGLMANVRTTNYGHYMHGPHNTNPVHLCHKFIRPSERGVWPETRENLWRD